MPDVILLMFLFHSSLPELYTSNLTNNIEAILNCDINNIDTSIFLDNPFIQGNKLCKCSLQNITTNMNNISG